MRIQLKLSRFLTQSVAETQAEEHWRRGEAILYDAMGLLFKNEFEQSDILLQGALEQAATEEEAAEREQGPYRRNQPRSDASGEMSERGTSDR